MKRILLVALVTIFVAWGSLTAPVVQPASAAAPIVSVICCSEGGLGLPHCNPTTSGMVALSSNGRFYRCFYWWGLSWGEWLPA